MRVNGLNNFIYEETGFDYGTCGQLLLDIAVITFSAMVAAKQHNSITKYVRCGQLEDVEREEAQIQAYGADNEEIRDKLPKLILGKNLEVVRPNINKTKQQVIEELPSSLFKLTWYCRTPFRSPNPIPCGRCKTCLEVEQALIALGREDEIASVAYHFQKKKGAN